MPQLQTRAITEDDGIEFFDDTVQQRLRLRVRRAVVAFIADLLDSARADHGAGMMAFNPLLDYDHNTVGGRLKAIITGIGDGQPWGDVSALLSDLTGQISLQQLEASVQTEIGKISAAVTDVGSVNQRLQQETDARIGAITDEATARATAITTAVNALSLTLLQDISAGDGALGSRITSEVGTLVKADTALGVRVDDVSARLNTGDIATSLAQASSYAYTKAQSDAATAAAVSTVRSEFVAGDTTVNTRISSEVQTLGNADLALGQRIDTVSARLNTGDIASSLAQASSYAYTKAQTDLAISVKTDAISARLNTGDIATSLAAANSYAYTKAQTDSAISSSAATINARLNNGGDIATSLANASSYAYTKAQTDAAISSSQTTLRSEFNPINARLNAGGDIFNSLATANSYAYTKAQTDSAISTSAATINARLNTGGDIATSLASASSYAYTKAQTDAAISASQTTLRSEYNPINARLNAGGDIYNSLATANSYAYTKAQTDAAISSSSATISARLNSGGDIAVSIANASNYAYTKAQSDAAISASQTTLRSEYNPINNRLNAGGDYFAAVTALQTAVAGSGGLQAQYVLKAVAQRGDGRPVFGLIGVAATAPSSGSGASQIILSADSLLFVPPSSIDSAPAGLLEVGSVDGVTTLRVPAARIGDLSVSTLKIQDRAVTVPVGAGLSSDWSLSASYTEQTMLYAGTIDTGGAPLFILAAAKYIASSSSTGSNFEVRVKINGTTVATIPISLPPSSFTTGTGFVAPLINSPGTGSLSVSMVVYSNGGSFTANPGTSIFMLGCKK